jgi:hypothetical protein
MSISPANDRDNVIRDAVAASCRETLHTEKIHHTQKSSIIHISPFIYVPARSIATESPTICRRLPDWFVISRLPDISARVSSKCRRGRQLHPRGSWRSAEIANGAERFAIKYRNILGRLFIVARGGREGRNRLSRF